METSTNRRAHSRSSFTFSSLGFAPRSLSSPAAGPDLAALTQALRQTAAAAQADGDKSLRPLAAALWDVADRLEQQASSARDSAAQLRDRLLVLHERAMQLRLVLSADACLIHADPPRAQAASQLLVRLPPPVNLTDDAATLAGATPLSAETALTALGEAKDILAVAAPQREALQKLGILNLVEDMDRSLGELTALAARLLRLPLPVADPSSTQGGTIIVSGLDSGMGSGRADRPAPAAPSADARTAAGQASILDEAAELCARYRAHVIVATGKLNRAGEDLARRQRLLAALTALGAGRTDPVIP